MSAAPTRLGRREAVLCGTGWDSKGQPFSANPSDASSEGPKVPRTASGEAAGETAGSVATEDRSELWDPRTAGALEVFTTESLVTYKQPTATPLDHV